VRLAFGFLLLLVFLAPGARAQQDNAGAKSARGDPVADAEAAIRRLNFGLLISHGLFSHEPPGVKCLTPEGRAPVVAGPSGTGQHNITPAVQEAWLYSQAYNRTIVSHPDYPDGDLCRVETTADGSSRRSLARLGSPARAVTQPPRDIFEAARRGSEEDVSRFLAGMPINGLDVFGMSALAWATARGNLPVVAHLASRGADPWGGSYGIGLSAVRISIVLGRAETFRRLLSLKPKPKPMPRWPAYMLSDAVASGNTEIVSHILAEPHEPYRDSGDLPPAETMALVLDRQPEKLVGGLAAANAARDVAMDRQPTSVADELLIKALDRSERLDLVLLALSKGANPNAKTGRAPWQTALGLAAQGFSPTAIDAVKTLLAAGADVNLMAGDRRPIWHAARTLQLGPVSSETKERATEIFRLLLQNGADPRLPNVDGKPPLWLMLFPRPHEPNTLDGSFMTAELLLLLAGAGMDVNALWNGRSVLAEVEKQAGPESPLAASLRQAGGAAIGTASGPVSDPRPAERGFRNDETGAR
jgi:ankyrin repeat protein